MSPFPSSLVSPVPALPPRPAWSSPPPSAGSAPPPYVPPPTRTVPRFAPVRVGGRRHNGALGWFLAAAGTLSLYSSLLISDRLG
ncbi:hypothetical protein ACIHFE_12965 [Streptomyces sp. NPDC052396]|uniref:hypothetical protein n=1 Tax=Streptomyces sp. NPDC052396 TaxID=3365689 RepID=UPI0037D3C67A